MADRTEQRGPGRLLRWVAFVLAGILFLLGVALAGKMVFGGSDLVNMPFLIGNTLFLGFVMISIGATGSFPPRKR